MCPKGLLLFNMLTDLHKKCTDTNNVLGDSLHTHPISRPLPLKVLACKALFLRRQAQTQAIVT